MNCNDNFHTCTSADELMKVVLLNLDPADAEIAFECRKCIPLLKKELDGSTVKGKVKNFTIVNTTSALHNILVELKKGATADRLLMEDLVNTMIHFLKEVLVDPTTATDKDAQGDLPGADSGAGGNGTGEVPVN